MNKNLTYCINRWVRWLLCLGLITGCQSSKTGPGSDSLASVEIRGHTPPEITKAVTATFKSAGFEVIPVAQAGEWRMQFERKAGAGSDLLYSDWSLTPIYQRARLKLITTGKDSYVVSCKVCRVSERGDKHFEEETPLTHTGKSTYQGLLDQSKARLLAAAR